MSKRDGDNLRELVLGFLGSACAICDSKDKLEIDHITPLSLGGRNVPSNVQILCYTCHKYKTKLDWQKMKRFKCDSVFKFLKTHRNAE